MFSSRRSPERRVVDEDKQLIRLQSAEAIGERQQINQDVSCRGPGTIENSTHMAVSRYRRFAPPRGSSSQNVRAPRAILLIISIGDPFVH